MYEDEHTLAFLDIHPCSKGHTVVVPKKHFGALEELTHDEFGAMMSGLQNAMKRVQGVIQSDGLNIAINNGEAAGQAVPHVHWHILPRWNGDGGGSAHSIIRAKDVGDVAETAKLFQ